MILSLVLCGCPERAKVTPPSGVYWYVNKLKDSIEINGYRKYNQSLSFTKSLKSNDSFSMPGSGVEILLPFRTPEYWTDSMIIRLIDGKCIYYVDRSDGLVTEFGEGVFGLINYRNYSGAVFAREDFVLFYDITAKDSILSKSCN